MTWVMLVIIISLGVKDDTSRLVQFSGELYNTEEACLSAAREPGWYENKHQVVALCVPGKAVFISPKQYMPRPKK